MFFTCVVQAIIVEQQQQQQQLFYFIAQARPYRFDDASSSVAFYYNIRVEEQYTSICTCRCDFFFLGILFATTRLQFCEPGTELSNV
ncbi:hypothetical protein T4D_1470 [Trichinella pseudospiralis]|uniref:Uncharacterized protein n=1 Tax=Trichinella pseudospiralis TaxID=6337 RepID=A0A0V1FZZ3_TRIPS|nr:hypothetical protein T4D_1470 [Trichinella pseudospiralis]